KENQFPINPSLSMTLAKCITTMEVEFLPRENELLLEVNFEGKKEEAFKKNLLKRLERVDIAWLSDFSLKIYSENSFPHSAGIASSASSMAALASILWLKALELGEENMMGTQKASSLARLFSGSACR